MAYLVLERISTNESYRTKRYKLLSIFGLALCSIGFGLVALRWYNPIEIWECLYMVLSGLGVGIVISTQFVLISAAAPKDRIATAVSLFYLAQQIGMMTGTSSSAAIVQSGFRGRLHELFPDQESVRLLLAGYVTSLACTSSNIPTAYPTGLEQHKLRVFTTTRQAVHHHLSIQEKLRCHPQ